MWWQHTTSIQYGFYGPDYTCVPINGVSHWQKDDTKRRRQQRGVARKWSVRMLALISIETDSINIELWLYWTNRLSHDDNRQFRCRCARRSSKLCIRACRNGLDAWTRHTRLLQILVFRIFFSLSFYRFESRRFSPNSVLFIYSFTRYRCREIYAT